MYRTLHARRRHWRSTTTSVRAPPNKPFTALLKPQPYLFDGVELDPPLVLAPLLPFWLHYYLLKPC